MADRGHGDSTAQLATTLGISRTHVTRLLRAQDPLVGLVPIARAMRRLNLTRDYFYGDPDSAEPRDFARFRTTDSPTKPTPPVVAMPYYAFAGALSAALVEHQMSDRDLATALDCRRSLVRRWRSGTSLPDASVLAWLHQRFGHPFCDHGVRAGQWNGCRGAARLRLLAAQVREDAGRTRPAHLPSRFCLDAEYLAALLDGRRHLLPRPDATVVARAMALRFAFFTDPEPPPHHSAYWTGELVR